MNRWSENIFPNEKNMCHQGIRQIKNISDFLFWYNQRMSEIMLIKSQKWEAEIILVYFVTRNLSLNNFGKNRGHRENILELFYSKNKSEDGK